MIRVSVKLFAALRDCVGQDECEIVLGEGSTAGAVIDKMSERYPRMKPWTDAVRLAVNCEYVRSEALLHDGDEVALIPPVSGG